MSSQQISKIKNLIADTKILSQYEKVEWLGLLELMNDKQLGELEEILESGQPASLGASQGGGAGGSGQKGTGNGEKAIVKPAPAGGPVAQMPGLSHIVNLPQNLGQNKSAVTKSPVSSSPPAVSTNNTNLDKNKQGFANKLKSIFSEKELTTSKPKYELELPAPMAEKKSKTNQVAPEAPMVQPTAPVKAETLDVTTAKTKPLPPIPPKSKTTIADLAAKLSQSSQQEPKISPALGQSNIEKQPVIDNKPKTKTPSEKFVPGINIDKPSEQTRNETLANIKQHLEETGGSSLTELKPATLKQGMSKDLVLKNLEDLTLLDVNKLDASDFPDLVKKIKQLVAKFGYFEVIFNFEKSPVYKIYIATGLKLLSEQSGFAELSSKTKAGDFLNKNQFEKFADLLGKIQST